MLRKKDIILEFFRNNHRLISGAFIFGFLSILTSVLIPVFIGKFYQLALHTHSTRGKIFDSVFGHIRNIHSFFFYFGGIVVARFIFTYGQKFFAGITAEAFTKWLREKLFAKQLVTHLGIHEQKETGKYLLRYSGDLSAVHNFITKGIIAFVNDCTFLIVALVIFFLIEPQLTLIILIAFPIIFVSIFLLNHKLKKYTRKRRNIRSQNLAFVSSRLSALLTIKIFNREGIESEKFEKRSTDLYKNGVLYYKWYAFINALLPFMLYTMLGIILLSAYQLKNYGGKEIQGSQILVFIMLTVNAIPVLRRILNVNIVWQTGDVSFKKLLLILNAEEELKTKEEESQFNTGRIAFENVSVGFDEGKMTIENFSALIPNYGIYLLDGKQGSGKSLLFKLILGLYDADQGKILIDTKDVAGVSKHTLRKNVTLVSDEVPLIGNTVFEAISYSRKEEKRAAASEILSALGFYIKAETSQLDIPVIEGGRNFSAGERKLLLIARALLTNKKIILLDEPFTDLDATFKNNVIEQLTKLRKKRTILVIDKDRNTQLRYDDVIQMEKNEEVEFSSTQV